MEKINSLFFLSILLVLAYSQLSDKGTPLNLPRKLQEKLNETILLGYENYNITSKDGLWAYFDTIFYLKNWTTDYINIMSNTSDYFIIKSIISNLNESKQIDFTCNNDYQWFYSYNLDNHNDHCKENGYCFAKYTCEANITGLGVLKKINLTTNFSEEYICNGTPISYVSSSAEALEKDLVSLKYKTEKFEVLNETVLISQSPTSFKIKGKEEDEDEHDISENLQLITYDNGKSKRIPCSIKYIQDPIDDTKRFFIESKGSNNLGGINLNYALLNYTKKKENENTLLILDFIDGGKNATILEPRIEQKKKSKGLSTGGIVGIVIPSCVVLLGAVGLTFFLSKRAVPPPPMNNIANKTLGVASSEAIVHQ